MNSSQKTSPNISGFFNKFFASLKPKKLALFVFLAILVLGFSVKISFAVTYNQNQLFDLKNTFGLNPDQITNLQKSNVAFDDFTKRVNDTLASPTYKDKTSAAAASTAANFVYNDVANPATSGDVTSASLNQFSGKAALQGLADGFSELVIAVVIGVLSIIAAFCKQMVSMGAQTLDFTLNPNLYNFTSNNMIVQGWTIMRDVCNLFFLLVLLFIAICTILKIEKYHAKKTLLMLIIMALLINFSKPIAIFIFDGSQLLMNEFLRQMGGTQGTGQTTSTIVAKSSEIANLVYDSLPKYWGSTDTSLNLATQYLFAVVFLFMLAVAFFVTALMLIIRIVAVMLLIIVAPFAFFAAIVPDFSKMSSQWWSSLFEYSYYGPAAAFFLLLATKLENALPHLTNNSSGTQFTAQNLSTTVDNIIHYLTVLVFLYASIFMAKKFGGGAGAAIVKNADRFLKWSGGMTKTGGMWGWGWRSGGFQGGLGQVAEQSKWTRWMTKRGRQRTQADRGAAIARVFGVKGAWFENFDKRSEEENKGLDYDSVNKKAQAGDERAALQSLKNGDGDDPLIFQTLMKTIKEHPEMRNHYRALYRKAGQFQLAAMLQELNPRDKHKNQIAVEINKEREEQHLPLYKDVKDALDKNTDLGKEVNNRLLKFYADEEVGRLGLSEIAKVDFHDFATNENVVPNKDARANLRKALYERLENLSEVKAEKYVDMASDTIGKNQTFFKRNTDFNKILQNAKTRAGVK